MKRLLYNSIFIFTLLAGIVSVFIIEMADIGKKQVTDRTEAEGVTETTKQPLHSVSLPPLPIAIEGYFGQTDSIARKRFDPVVGVLKRKTQVPVALPVNFPDEDAETISLWIMTATRSEYELSLDKGEDCRGAGACNYGFITGKRNKTRKPTGTINFPFELKESRRVSLAKGIRGYFVDFTCGASCDSAKIFWLQNGFQYMVGIKAGGLEDLTKLANSVINNQRL